MKRFELLIQEKHYLFLEREAKRRGKSKAQYVRDLITKRASNKALEELVKIQTFNCEILLQISRLSQNINQIAHYLNSGLEANPKEFFRATDELKNIIQEARKDLKKNSNLLLKII